MGIKKTVTNEQLIKACENTDNKNCMNAMCNSYRKVLSEGEIKACQEMAIWKTLASHDEQYGQKFTSSLCRFLNWELIGFVRKKSKPCYSLNLDEGRTIEIVDRRACAMSEEMQHVIDRMEKLPFEWQKRVIRQYYLEGLNFEQVGKANGWSREWSRTQVANAMEALKKLCRVGV